MNRTWTVLAALLLTPSLAAADTHPNSAGGFASDKAFQVGEVDNVNLFNGNLVLTLPIGQPYPVGGGLSYGLTLVYNSNPWRFQQRHDTPKNVDYNQAYPNPLSNAGLGWQLSPGRLLSPSANINNVPVNDSGRWIYLAPDGSEHIFYNTLHRDETAVTDVSYTRDGSYLRMKKVGVAREIEFPDGTIHRFDSTGMLVQIRNRFSVDATGTANDVNIVTITYTQPWTIADNHGRTQKIYFTTLDQDGAKVEVVDRVELTGFGATTSTYTFGYSSATIRRPCPHNEDPDVMPVTAQVQFLTSLTLPDGSSFSMPGTDYVTDAPTSGALCRGSGSIRGLTLPTLGKLAWEYMEYRFPDPSSSRPYRQLRAGVGTRKSFDASGVLLGQWTYSTSLSDSDLPDPIKEEMINSVTDPLGNKRVHYFSVYTGGSASAFPKEDYSLPFSRYANDGAGRFISTQVYNPAGTLLRSTYVRYQRDATSEALGFQDELNVNRREETSRTVYHDDGGRYTEATRSGFDGLGHYRQTQTGGNFASGDAKTNFVNFNPDRGTYQLDASGNPMNTFSMLPSTSPWILDTFTEQKVTEGSSTDHTLFCFEAGTGFLSRKRVLKSSPSLLTDDVLTVYTADSAGNLASESWHGADSNGLSKTDTCAFTPPAAHYQLNHTYAAGVLATSKYTGAGFYSARQDIDIQSGLPSASYDTAGLKTEYEYDTLGRLTWAKPATGHGAWTEYVYNRATSATSLATVIVRKRSNGSKTGGVIVPAQVHFDALGRVWKELTFLPGTVWSVRNTLYNGAGWKSQVSEPYLLTPTASPTSWTKFLDYDPFGRPKTIRPPDGLNHDVTVNYYGVRVVDRTVKVGTAYNAGVVTESAATTTEVYDHHGRLDKVTEPSGASGANVTTTYDYDAGNRLIHVQTTAPVSGVSTTQNRWFNYDSRGFLTSEIHPEKGIDGNGRVDYSKYDGRGHAGRIVDGPNDLSYTYDFAERLTDVWETGGRQLKQYVWDTAAGWGNGKLAQSDRFNYPVLGATTHTVLITEAYGYGGIDGRTSQRNTRLLFNGGQAELFTQTFGWTQLGDISTLGYPQCAHAGCSVPSPRTVTNGYSNGLLTSVSSGAVTYGTINYHINGMVNQVIHANGVTDTQALDSTSMRRPGSITSTFGGATRWTTGSYTYDGAGNIKQMGTSWFTYDKVSRLTTGTVFVGPTGGGAQKQQTYTFDPFGNLTAIGGTSGRNVPINPATNRQNATDVTYDAAGNLTAWNGNTYQYDAFNNMWRMKSGAEEWLYVYTADGERVWSFKVGANLSRWTLRDLSGQVLREYINNQGTWSLGEDYLYRDSLLLAAEPTAGRRHFHLDHLGTPRLITDAAANQVAYHVYYPFGEEATAFNQDAERMKFTGHERDLASLAGAGDDLDYMHARHYGTVTGRFISTDRLMGSPKRPQSWNRYVYAGGNPLRYVDPDGNTPKEFIYKTYYIMVDMLNHGGPHLDVYKLKGGRPGKLLGRIDIATGKLIAHKGSTGSIPNSVMKWLRTAKILGLAGTAVGMFLDASPANADSDLAKIFGIPEAAAAELAKSMFNVTDLNSITWDQMEQIYKEYSREEAEKEEERNDASERMDEFNGASCFFNGICAPRG